MPAHARPRQPLLGRGPTLLAMTVTVSALATVALVNAPRPAAAQQADDPAPVSVAAAPVETVGDQLMADLSRQQQAEQRKARERREERRERREARQERRERRAEARAAARAAARAPQWVFPVSGAGWSASFGEAGSAWSSGYHTGQDFTAPSGAPVYAVGAGTITSASWSDAYGNIIEITHAGGDQSWYAHMSSFEQTSGSVSVGDVIGYVGCTGNCYGNHLHLEFHPGGGEAADPVAWLRENGA